jgi:hypothetical protein
MYVAISTKKQGRVFAISLPALVRILSSIASLEPSSFHSKNITQ